MRKMLVVALLVLTLGSGAEDYAALWLNESQTTRAAYVVGVGAGMYDSWMFLHEMDPTGTATKVLERRTLDFVSRRAAESIIKLMDVFYLDPANKEKEMFWASSWALEQWAKIRQ